MQVRTGLAWVVLVTTIAATGSPAAGKAPPLRIGYSDWPGYVPFEIALQKRWFEAEGVEVTFHWLDDYAASIDAFRAGKYDAVCMTNGDALVAGAGGAKSKFVLLLDYSSGNDQIIGQPGIRRFSDLRGKKVGVELTMVDHLLLLQALKTFGMTPADVTLVNVPAADAPRALQAGRVSAVGTFYPHTGLVRQLVSGARPLFTSANAPGLIYDTLAVAPASLAERKADWAKVVRVWYRVVEYLRAPRTHNEAVALMAHKAGVPVAEYDANLLGTYILTLPEARRRFAPGPGLGSIHGSTRTSDAFNVASKLYAQPQDVAAYVYPDLVMAQ